MTKASVMHTLQLLCDLSKIKTHDDLKVTEESTLDFLLGLWLADDWSGTTSQGS